MFDIYNVKVKFWFVKISKVLGTFCEVMPSAGHACRAPCDSASSTSAKLSQGEFANLVLKNLFANHTFGSAGPAVSLAGSCVVTIARALQALIMAAIANQVRPPIAQRMPFPPGSRSRI